ncbi:MAG: SRPBCC family protein [Deltaproteobacteria bacterium]|nr:SRPBCC family protein [Deltaproteobacteria bacterium]
MRLYRLERTQVVPQTLEEVFAFFTDAGNLELITPEFLHFRMLTPLPIHMEPGALIEYRLQLFSIPFFWRTRIEIFEPGRRFSDIQLVGPYRRWHHLHEFSQVPDGTLMRDTIDYALPLGPLGTLAHMVFVRRTLEQIFDYRRDRIEQLLGYDRKGPP